MSDRTLGMIVATAIAAPVVAICCGGGLALAGSALAGLGGWLSGATFPSCSGWLACRRSRA